MEFKDYYQLLEVSPNASDEEIKKSYRRLARKYHPDVSKEPDAETKFKEIQEAHAVLKDKEKRRAYDQAKQAHAAGKQYQPPPDWDFQGSGANDFSHQDFSDFFSDLFGRQGRGGHHSQNFQQRGRDQHAKLSISLHDAFHGTERTITLNQQGKTETLNVKIPKGIKSGQNIRLKGKGYPGIGGGAPGDLYLEIDISNQPPFSLDHQDIYLTLPLAPWEAALGATIDVPTMAGTVKLKIPAGSQSGKKLRLKGKGLPGTPQGDQYVILKIVIPDANNATAKKLYQEMAEKMAFNPREKLV